MIQIFSIGIPRSQINLSGPTEATEAHFFPQESSSTRRFSVRQYRISVRFHRIQVELDSCGKSEPQWLPEGPIITIFLQLAYVLSDFLQGFFLSFYFDSLFSTGITEGDRKPVSPMQTSEEISFFDSPKDSIFYSIARFFYQTAILCCHKNPVANSLQG